MKNEKSLKLLAKIAKKRLKNQLYTLSKVSIQKKFALRYHFLHFMVSGQVFFLHRYFGPLKTYILIDFAEKVVL